MTYARWWRAGWSLITALGLGIAILQMFSAALFAVALLAATAAVVIVLAHASHRRRQPDPERVGGREVVERALEWGALLLAACTVTGDSPPVALLLALAAVTTCPPAVRLYRRAVRRETVCGDTSADRGEVTAAHAEWGQDDALRMVLHLSEADLCELWRSTFWELHEQHTGDERLTLVTLRQICLDELGRRDPRGLQAWLSSGAGARASSSPDRFLQPPDQGSHDAA